MAGPSQFSVGGTPLNPKIVNTQSLRELYRAARAAETEEGKQEVLDTIEQLGKTGEISAEQFAAMSGFSKGVFKEFRSDKDRMWDTWKSNGRNWKDPQIKAIQEEMGVSGAFLFADNKLKTAYREATALAAVQALAGGSFGPAPLVGAYAAYINGKDWNKDAQAKTERLMDTYKAYQSGDSPMISRGNRIKQVHRAELWRTLGELTSEAVEAGKSGKPVPVLAQYYELTSPDMVGKLAAAAKAGSPLRLNLDPGRLSYPSKDENKNQYFDVDDIPHKMRTILQFTGMEGVDVGVSVFPIKQQLEDPTDLMHRKVLQVGDKVLMSGMNANDGSGENIDAGYVIEGPAARKYAANVARDIKLSTGAGTEEIWGAEHMEQFKQANLKMGNRGITALLDNLAGPSRPGEDLPKTKTLADLEALAKKAGVDLKEMFDVPAADYERVVGEIAAGHGKASLSAAGKQKFVEVINRAIDSTKTDKNKKALADIELPSDKPVGKTQVDIADSYAEREVMMLNAIDEAQEFIYLPGFVVTRAIAAALVAKKEQFEAAGKKIDIRVMADSGIYPDGGTPNSWGMNFLDDAGVDTRWAKLTRSGWHDIKIHAKQLLTDRGEVAGSTNFTGKGLQENHETSAYVHFDPSDPDAIANREASKAQFLQLWEEQSFGLNAKDVAAYDNRFAPKVGKEYIIEQGRDRGTSTIIEAIAKFEEETAKLVEGFLSDPNYKKQYDIFLEKGYSEGDAAFKAADQVYGKEEFLKMRQDLPSNQELLKLENRINEWKAKWGARDGATE